MGRVCGVMTKQTIWFPNRPSTNRAVQAQRMARDWKLWIKKVEDYPCSETVPTKTTTKTAGVCCGIPIFLFLLQNIDCWYSLEPPNVYPQSMF